MVRTGISVFCVAAIVLLGVSGYGAVVRGADFPDCPPGGAEWAATTSSANQVESRAREKLDDMSPEEVRALDARLEKALDLYYGNRYSQALPVFKEVAAQVETLDVMFWMGSCAAAAGDLSLAAAKFTDMLEADPCLHRVRLERAYTYIRMGDFARARRDLETVLAHDPPPQVRQNVEKMLQAVSRERKRLHWNLGASTGVKWDDNVTAGPDKRELAVTGGTLVLSPGATEREDWAWIADARGNVLYEIMPGQGLAWNTEASFYNMAYFDHSSQNYLLADASTGPWWSRGPVLAKLPVGLAYKEYGSDRLSWTLHVDPSLTYQFRDNVWARFLYSYTDENYFADNRDPLAYESHYVELRPSYGWFDNEHVASLIMGLNRHDAGEPSFAYDSWRLGFSYRARFRTETAVQVQYFYESLDFEGIPVLYTEEREDDRHTFWVNVTQSIWKGLYAGVSYQCVKNDSNAGLYEFDKNTVTVSLGYNF